MILGGIAVVVVLVYLAILFTGVGDVQVYKNTGYDISGKAREKYHAEMHEERKKLQEKLQNIPQTSVEVDSVKFVFGNIPENKKQKHTYLLRNTGEEMLVIGDVRVSCGCTLSDFTEAPVPPGEEAKVDIVYDPSGQSGHVEKRLHVYANVQRSPIALGFVADIENSN